MQNLFSLPQNTSKTGFLHATSGNVDVIKSNLTATADPSFGNDNTQGYSAGSTWVNTTTKSVFNCADATTGLAIWHPQASYPINWVKAIGSDVLALSRTDSSSVDAIDPMIYALYNTPISGAEVAPVIYGYFKNTSNVVGLGGHGIGCLGRSEDTTVGATDLIGVEGRIDSFGSAGGHCSFLGISNWSGASFTGRAIYGHIQRVEIRTAPDVGSPVNQGVAVSFFAPSIVGGDPANKWSFYGFDPMRTRGQIRCFNADDSQQILFNCSGFDSYIQSTTKIRMAPAATEYLILEDCLGFIPLTNARKLGDGSLSLNWQVHASSVLVNNTQVLSTRKTGWTAATGTATRTTFATGSVTLSVLAEHVKALIDDLISHGVIGT